MTSLRIRQKRIRAACKRSCIDPWRGNTSMPKAQSNARSPHNDDPFRFSEDPAGKQIRLEQVCAWAGVACVVTRAIPLDIRIHAGENDFIAARPGFRAYCLAAKYIPRQRKEAGRYMLERLAYGAHEWCSKEILQSHHRRLKRERDMRIAGTLHDANLENAEGEPVHESDPNIFADLELPDAETHFAKARIVAELYQLAQERGQAAAAVTLGIGEDELSRLLKGHFRAYPIDRLTQLRELLARSKPL